MKASLTERYVSSHPKSAQWHERALKKFAGDGATHFVRILDPFRPYVTHALGSRKWDIDGHEYIDYCMGHGSLMLGHSYPSVVKAVQEQAAKGFHYGENTQIEVEWAELISSMMPAAERVEFCSCGQEANLLAVILARAYTGRTKILRFADNYHGWGGEVGPYDAIGIYQPAVTLLPMNDPERTEEALATREYALCMIEGGGAIMAGQVPWDWDVARQMSALTKKYGTVFLIDEVVTGFRESRGGWQEVLGVTPDLSTLGKSVSGGIPSGVVVGRADILDVLNPKRPLAQRVAHLGTWNANPLQSAAGVAACKEYLSGTPFKTTLEMATLLREKGNAVIRQRGLDAWLYGRTIVHLYLGPIEFEPQEPHLPPTKNVKIILNPDSTLVKLRLCLALLQRGVATMGGRFFVMSGAHTEADVGQTVEAFACAVDDLIEEGTLKTR
jgi:glutamate-1-semialdehyde 2,1-aminomutase